MSNTLYTHDNLFILNGLNSRSVDLIYLDPPFNTKRVYSAPVGSKAAGTSFKDMWTWADINKFYLDTLATEYSSVIKFIMSVGNVHSKAMAAYLTYMAQRLVQMHRILKDTGSICFHCDPTASHYIKMLLDMIFGKNNFRNEIIWKRNEMLVSRVRKKYRVATDQILFYTKTENYTFNPQLIKSENDPSISYKLTDIDGRKYRAVLITGHKALPSPKDKFYEYKGYIPEYGWNVDKETLVEMDADGLLIWKDGVCKNYKKYLDERTEPASSLWTDIISARGKEYVGYPTQKPLKLLYRLINTSSNSGDVVLDPFCGCATTCVAAQQLGRKWIGIDIEKNAVALLKERLEDDAGIYKDFIATDKIPIRTDVVSEPPDKKSIKERLYSEQNGKCNGCGVAFELRNLVTDHIIPVHHGGGSYYENYQLLCGHCNSTKGARPMEYLMKKVAVRTAEIEKDVFFSDREWEE